MIGLAVMGVQADAKRLSVFLRAILGHLGVKWGQTKAQGCPNSSGIVWPLVISVKPTKKQREVAKS